VYACIEKCSHFIFTAHCPLLMIVPETLIIMSQGSNIQQIATITTVERTQIFMSFFLLPDVPTRHCKTGSEVRVP